MAKNNGKIKIIVVIVGAVLTLAGVVMSVAKTYFVIPVEIAHNVKNNDDDHREFKADIEDCQDWMSQTGKELVGIKKDVGYLSKKLDDNLVEQKAFQVEQRTMQKEIIKKIQEINR